MRFSNNSVLRFYFKSMATVNLSKNKAAQPEFAEGKGGLNSNLKNFDQKYFIDATR